jgi:hypothetical protein
MRYNLVRKRWYIILVCVVGLQARLSNAQEKTIYHFDQHQVVALPVRLGSIADMIKMWRTIMASKNRKDVINLWWKNTVRSDDFTPGTYLGVRLVLPLQGRLKETSLEAEFSQESGDQKFPWTPRRGEGRLIEVAIDRAKQITGCTTFKSIGLGVGNRVELVAYRELPCLEIKVNLTDHGEEYYAVFRVLLDFNKKNTLTLPGTTIRAYRSEEMNKANAHDEFTGFLQYSGGTSPVWKK